MSYKVIHSIFILLIAVTVVLSHFPALAQSSTVKDPWTPFQFLVGNWSGTGSGKPGEAAGTSSFSFDLGRKVLIRRNKVEFPPQPGEKLGTIHEDLMIIYHQSGDSQFRAIYFDNEGHIINYAVPFRQNSRPLLSRVRAVIRHLAFGWSMSLRPMASSTPSSRLPRQASPSRPTPRAHPNVAHRTPQSLK